ncbi:MAG TPA: hypothetical protein VFC33_09795 [Acidimicrobiia bacterium]|nr:hypothetical protein [Acidimicrobiia bacterium]
MRRFWSWLVGSSVVVALATFGIGSVGTATAGAAQGGTVRAAATSPCTPPFPNQPYWQGWDIATGVALLHDGTCRGYVLDGWGGFHPFGNPPPPALFGGKHAVGQVVAHNMAIEGSDVLNPTNPPVRGAVINTHAKAYPFGANGVTPVTYATNDQSYLYNVPTRAISLDPAPAGSAYNLNGATIDAWGGIHPFSTVTETIDTCNAPYWPKWNIVRGLALLPNGQGGFTLDGWGGVHAFGKAQLATPPDTYWGPSFGHKAWDIARGVAIDNNGNGVVLDGWGGLHPFTYTINAAGC